MTLMCLVILQIYELEHEPYNLRNTEPLFRGVYARAKTFNYTFFPRVVRSWNKLPISMKKSDSVSEFKQELITTFFHFGSLHLLGKFIPVL